jgi:hypothetical protein
MDDALLMRSFKRVGDVDGNGDHSIARQRTRLDQLLQRFPVEELHCDEGAAAFFSDLMNGADIGMIQRGSSARLPPEALQSGAVIGEVVGQEFESDEPAKERVLGLIDHAHTTAADLL